MIAPRKACLAAILAAALLWAVSAQGQSISAAPSPPSNPTSKEQCEAYRVQHDAHMSQIRNALQHCTSISSTDLRNWVVIAACGVGRLNVQKE